MIGFIDEVVLEVSSGHGGPGHVSFRREKYVPRGGPDGGDGGRGGDVIFVVQKNLKTLAHLARRRTFKAEDGQTGLKRKKSGRDGNDINIAVPPGTIIRDYTTKTVLKDLSETDTMWFFLKGGIGGQGNQHFATAARQVPRFAQPGREGEYRKIIVELNLIADIGFVGLPNAGKSTLLSVLTAAHPKIASYPFTTKIPNLGVMKYYDQDIVLADIPGIIKGAAQGAGLGLKFLKHIARTRLIVFLIDLGDSEYSGTVELLEKELHGYAPQLLAKKRLILGTKMDILGAKEHLGELKAQYPGQEILGISAVTRTGLDKCRAKFFDLVRE